MSGRPLRAMRSASSASSDLATAPRPPTAVTSPPNTSISTPTTPLEKGAPMNVERLEAVKKAGVLVEALPFIRKFHGDTMVVKIGGSSIAEARANILEDIVLLRYVGMNPVAVHGGGPV